MTVTRNPLHGSQRAGLPHWALALGDNAKSLERIGMSDTWWWKPALDEPPHPLPVQPGGLAAPAQRAIPEPPYLETEREQRRPVHWHAVILEMPLNHPTQPCSHHRDRSVQPPPR